MKKLIVLPLTIVLIMSAGCAGTKQEAGSVLGAGIGVGLGSMIGSGSGKTAAMILGGLFGATLGSSIGTQLDERDKLLLERNTQGSLENTRSGQTSSWSNPDTNHYGSTTPEPSYRKNDQDCRDFTQTIYIDGKKHVGRGTACRNQHGEWIIQ